MNNQQKSIAHNEIAGAVGEMGCNGVAGMKVADRTDDLTVPGEKTVASAVELFGIAGGKALREEFDTVETEQFLPLCGALQAD